MILLIKHKIQQGQEPEFTLTVDELAKHFDINIANNHDRKKKVIATLNAINKNLTQTKFEYEFVKKENEKWAYSVKFRFSEETLKYFDEKAKAIITAKYYEGLKDAFLRKKAYRYMRPINIEIVSYSAAEASMRNLLSGHTAMLIWN